MNLDKFAGGELTRLIRKGINEILDNIRDEGTTPQARRTLTVKITFRPAKDRKNMKIQIETRVNKAPVRATETNMFIGQEFTGFLHVRRTDSRTNENNGRWLNEF